ncbi:SDR family NAD(P)-dependent oxidoreductase [Mycobacterium aquaticum]|uniref:Oxidoreductase n=1 Tax=Mycobacterium aquaticum TaxID=1927124 RepID=A0A1X0BAE6_9MYCO|nr:SDR family oxidoreductase [Mycobacterium aquaticum]ORA39175.1 oxidoreductase [Mycobacterium aquaticum]
MTTAAAPDRTTRVAIVTGAASGIGAAIARRLSHHGVRVVALDRSEAVRDIAQEIGGRGLVGDITDAAFTANAVELAQNTEGRLDILVNAAGIQHRTDAVDIDEDSWSRLLEVNLSAAYRLSRQSAKALAATHGCIVNIASLSADRAVPGIVPYGATKAALVQLSRGLAVEMGPDGVRVNAVAPGYIETPMTRDVLSQDEFRSRVLSRIPLRRLADGDDVADVVVFLTSTAARYVTGVVLPVDGGYSIT